MLDRENIISFIIYGIVCVGCLIGGYMIGTISHKKIKYEFDVSKDYTFVLGKYNQLNLDKDVDAYICNMCEQYDIDSDLVVAILMQENPSFNPYAINRNSNGTTDQGLFQLNDKYLYTDFIPKYWDIKEIEFDVFNWKHNCFMAITHIYYLKTRLKADDEVIQAYNCGINATMKNKIPASTKNYLAAVKNNLLLLKGEQNVSNF